jgi:hypothetical protein
MKRDLNLHFANIKASPAVYWWMFEEVEGMDKHRREVPRRGSRHADELLLPFEDNVNFPLP